MNVLFLLLDTMNYIEKLIWTRELLSKSYYSDDVYSLAQKVARTTTDLVLLPVTGNKEDGYLNKRQIVLQKKKKKNRN